MALRAGPIELADDEAVIGDVDDFLGAEATDDPYHAFAVLRRTTPVTWSERYRSWIFMSWDSVSQALRDHRLSSARLAPSRTTVARHGHDPVYDLLSAWVTFNDPPAHTRLRGAIQQAFKPAVVQGLASEVQSCVDELLDDIDRSRPFDVVTSFAEPLPDTVIARLLGIPPDGREVCKSWARDLRPIIFGNVDDTDRFERALVSMRRFRDYLTELVDSRAREPRDDLLSALVVPPRDAGGLTRDEVIATVAVILFGGQETTRALISNSLAALARFPDAQATLRRSPELFHSAIEEFLRFDGPTKFTMRVAREEIQVAGRTVAAGDRVFLGIASANRDEQRFADPDRLDFRRGDPRHLGFGFGIHHCIGAPLARLEATIALRSFLGSFSSYEVVEPVSWRPSLVDRSVENLEVRAS